MYLKDDVHDKHLVQSWVTHIDYSRVFPLVATVENQIVGDVSLHFHTGPTRHIGRVRIGEAASVILLDLRLEPFEAAVSQQILEPGPLPIGPVAEVADNGLHIGVVAHPGLEL